MTDQYSFLHNPCIINLQRNDAHFVHCYSRLFPDTQCAVTFLIIFKGIILDFQ